ncbi:MAG: SUMF1/EgtB/PvdO family nonheme iron enzyme [Myxococcota bacterium]
MRSDWSPRARFNPWTAGAVLLTACSFPGVAFAADCRAQDPSCVALLSALTGTYDFFATGASFAVADDPSDDRPTRVLDVAEVSIPTRRIPTRATLTRAYLYFGGSLFLDNDGNDGPDMTVEVQLPGASDFVEVHGDALYRSAPIPGFPEVTLYTVRADITELMKSAGGEMAGTYRVRGFNADIFYRDQRHTAANASFSVVVVFEEPRLPPRTIALFDGMQEVLGSTVTLDLGGFLVSPVPSGSLTFYALEGDCNPGPGDCAHGNNLSGAERIRVRGSDPARQITLSDAVNPPNDIFNRTINTVDPIATNIPGTDIDAFDITSAIRPGDTSVEVEITTPTAKNGNSGELIGLAYVIVGVDVFAPELRVDSRIEILSAEGQKLDQYYPGDPLRIAYVMSNTGNLPATDVRLVADLPADVTRFEVADAPLGATLTVSSTGGAAGHGRVTLEGLNVRHGEARDLVLLVETTCPLPNGGSLALSGDVSYGSTSFTRTSSATLLARDRCGPHFFLYGGGGCSDVPPPASGGRLGFAALGLLALFAHRRPRARWLAVLALLFTGCGGAFPEQPDAPPADIFGISCPGDDSMIAIPSTRGRQPYCIDRFEASGQGQLGNADQGTSGDAGDGSTTLRPVSARFAAPITGASWFQARAACANAGKRLCAPEEWVTACRGEADGTYPYGDSFEPTTCNGFGAGRDGPVETGAMFRPIEDGNGSLIARGCVSSYGIYDLSGNVWEWNSGSYLEGTRRGLAGGGFRSNAAGLRCVTDDNYETPAANDGAYGFRCCKDFPR